MLSTNKIYDTIINYLSHQLSVDEIVVFEKWLNNSEKNKKLFEKVSKYWNSNNITVAENKDIVWEKLSKAIAERNSSFIYRNSFSIAVAASIILLIASGWFLKTTTDKMVNIVTNEHSFKCDTLNNGSIVYLYPSSSINVEQSSLNNEMIIKLTGEAFFIVPPNKGNKVKICVGGASIKVTGTSFRVCGNNNQEVSVVVESGQVILKDKNRKNKQLIVQAGEQGYYINSDTELRKKQKTENIYLIYQPDIIN